MHGLMLSSALATLPVVIPTGPCRLLAKKRAEAVSEGARALGISEQQALEILEFASDDFKNVVPGWSDL